MVRRQRNQRLVVGQCEANAGQRDDGVARVAQGNFQHSDTPFFETSERVYDINAAGSTSLVLDEIIQRNMYSKVYPR